MIKNFNFQGIRILELQLKFLRFFFFLEFFQQIVLFWFIVRNIQMYWLMYRLK